MLYVDSSAALKLVRQEHESTALTGFLEDVDDTLVTSRVGIVELRRVARRGGASPDRADAIAGTLEIIELDAAVEGIAVTLAPELRALDAIHLASADLWRQERGPDLLLATHDKALALAARAVGFRVVGV